MNVIRSIEELIGNTPLVSLETIEKEYGLHAHLYAKLESMNLTGSAKDRAAKKMIEDAEERGLLKEGTVIIEPTSGNTGIALSAIGNSKGYRVMIVMPDTMSVERRKMISAYGAEVVLSDGKQGMKGAIAKAEELKNSIGNAWIAGQFDNPANWMAHYETTGPEIEEALQGRVDILVAGVGTGGTITGAGKYLKEKNHTLTIIAAEPEKSPVLSHGTAGPHGIQGIGAGFVPKVLDESVYDEVMTVSDEDALHTGAMLARHGLFVGISSGAAMHAAIQAAQRKENEGKHIVVVFPDSGDRYLSTAMFQ